MDIGVIYINISMKCIGHTIAQEASCWLLTSEARVRTQFTPAGFMVDRVVLGQISLRVLRFSFVRIIPPLLHIHSCIIWRWTEGQFHRHIVSPRCNSNNNNNDTHCETERMAPRCNSNNNNNNETHCETERMAPRCNSNNNNNETHCETGRMDDIKWLVDSVYFWGPSLLTDFHTVLTVRLYG
jgi:hypothetical protein